MDSLVLASPDAAIAAVPHILGFCPQASLVLLWCGRERIVLTQRLDLVENASGRWIDEASRHGVALGAESVIVIVFTERRLPGAMPGRPIVDALERRLADSGVDLLDALLVDEERWWSYRCDEPCCPPDGRLVDPVIAEEVIAGFVLQGSAPFPSRAALVASLASVEDGLVDPIGRPAGTALEVWRDEMLAGPIARLLGGGANGEGDVGLILGALADVRVRDTALWHLAQAEDWRATLGALSGLVRVAAPGCIAPIATLTAIAAWLTGDGARASIAVDRALDENPGYGLAVLVDGALRAGIAPMEWLAMLRRMPVEVCRHGESGGPALPARPTS